MTTPAEEAPAVSERAASRILDVPVYRLRRWSSRHLVQPPVVRRLSARRQVRLYSFTNMVELAVLKNMLDKGVHPLRVGSFVDFIHKRGHQLSRVEVAVSAGRAFWREGHDQPWSGGRDPAQGVLPEILDLERIRGSILRRAAARPGQPGQIERIRGAVGSKPVFAGTRLPVKAVQEWIEDGASTERILQAYPFLTAVDVEAARRRIA